MPRGAGTSTSPATGGRRRTHDAPQHTTFDGRALAVVRPTGAGAIAVVVGSEGMQPVTLELEARPVG